MRVKNGTCAQRMSAAWTEASGDRISASSSAAMTAADTAISEKARFAEARRRRPTTRWIAASVRHAAASIDQRTVVQLMESSS